MHIGAAICLSFLNPLAAVGFAVGAFASLAIPKSNSVFTMKTMNLGEMFDIGPNDVFNRIMFVKSQDLVPKFNLLLTNKETKETEIFRIDLSK